jgi:hypothetical protein
VVEEVCKSGTPPSPRLRPKVFKRNDLSPDLSVGIRRVSGVLESSSPESGSGLYFHPALIVAHWGCLLGQLYVLWIDRDASDRGLTCDFGLKTMKNF